MTSNLVDRQVTSRIWRVEDESISAHPGTREGEFESAAHLARDVLGERLELVLAKRALLLLTLHLLHRRLDAHRAAEDAPALLDDRRLFLDT
jgi:hypothetical protein